MFLFTYSSMALWKAIVNRTEADAENLLRHKGVDVNYQHNREWSKCIKSLKRHLSLRGLPRLHVAALACYPEIVKVLIQIGADPLVIDANDRTARTLLSTNLVYVLKKHQKAANEIL